MILGYSSSSLFVKQRLPHSSSLGLTGLLAAVVLLVTGASAPAAASPQQPGWQSGLSALKSAAGPVLVRFDTATKRPVLVAGMNLPVMGGDAQDRAKNFLNRYGSLFGLDPTLVVSPRTMEWAHGQVVRFSLAHQGLPIWGPAMFVRLQGRNVTAAAGKIPDMLSFDSPVPLRSAGQIEADMEADTGRPARVLGLGYVPMGGEGVLAWIVEQRFSGPPWRLIVTVEDATGRILFARSGVLNAEGYVYDPNPTVARDYSEVSLPNLTNTQVLEGTYAEAYQCGNGGSDYGCPNWEHGATADAQGNFLYTPLVGSMSDNFAEVQGYYHVDKYNRWLEERFGFVWSCNNSRVMKVFVNWNDDNAFYADSDGDPNACGDLTFGEGSVDYVYDADVIYHEFTHGMVEHTCNLGCPDIGICYDGQGLNMVPYSLNEGTADYFSMAYTNDPNLGDYAGQATGEPYIRSAINDMQCPWDQIAESHYDGQIWMGGLWEIRTALGPELGDDLAYGAVISLPTDADYDMASQMVMQTAQEMAAVGRLTQQQINHIQRILGPQGRGMMGCHRIVPLDHRPPGKDAVYAYGIPTYQGYIDELPVALQWSIDVPEDGRRLHFQAAAQAGSSWRIFASAGRPVTVQVTRGGFVYQADHEFDNTPWDVYINSSTNPPLQQGTTYYFMIVYSNAPWGEFWQLSGDVTTGPEPFPEPLPDAGTDVGFVDVRPRDAEPTPRDGRSDRAITRDASPMGSTIPDSISPRQGCDCATQSPSGGVPLLIVLSALLWWKRRGTSTWKN